MAGDSLDPQLALRPPVSGHRGAVRVGGAPPPGHPRLVPRTASSHGGVAHCVFSLPGLPTNSPSAQPWASGGPGWWEMVTQLIQAAGKHRQGADQLTWSRWWQPGAWLTRDTPIWGWALPGAPPTCSSILWGPPSTRRVDSLLSGASSILWGLLFLIYYVFYYKMPSRTSQRKDGNSKTCTSDAVSSSQFSVVYFPAGTEAPYRSFSLTGCSGESALLRSRPWAGPCFLPGISSTSGPQAASAR